jgi:hypothetical protein
MDAFTDAGEMPKVSVGDALVEPLLNPLDFWVQFFKEREPLFRDGVDDHSPVFRAPRSLDEPSLHELVDEAGHVGGRVEHAVNDLTARMAVRMHTAKNAKHIVVTELQIVLSAGGLYPSPHRSGGHKEVQHGLLRLILEGYGLFDSFL